MSLNISPVQVKRAEKNDPFAQAGAKIYQFDVIYTSEADWTQFINWLQKNCKGAYLADAQYRSPEGKSFHTIYNVAGPQSAADYGKGKVIFYRRSDAALTKTFFSQP